MTQLALTLAGTIALTSGLATGQVATSDLGHVDAKNIRYVGSYDAATHVMTPATAANRGVLGDPIYANNSLPGTFYNIEGGDGGMIIDEGRVPGPTSTNVVGTQNSYTLTSLQIAYVTNATDPSLGGTGVDLRINLYESFAPCGLLSSTDAPIAVIDLLDLPASTTGGFAGQLLDVDLTGLGICLRADGDDDYLDGTSDLFGWSLEFIDNADGTGGGPFIAGRPDMDAPGNGTAFQMPGSAGTGLDTQDLWREYDPDGSIHCFWFGGYDPVAGTPYGSFYMVVRSDLAGDCIGCGIGDDRFEMNDSQMDAAPVDYDSYGALISDVNDDYYAITIPAGGALTADILFVDAESDLDLIVYDAGSGSIIATGFTTTDNESVVVENCDPMNSQDVFVRVDNFSDVCSEYDMILGLDPLFADDSFEDNDICTTAVPGPLGTTRDLIVRPCGSEENPANDDDDYFTYMLPAGESITADILFVDAVADIDGILYDITGGCPGSSVDTGFSTTDNEHLAYTNNTGGALMMAVRINHFSGDSALYDLNVKIGPESISEVICLGDPNSVGDGARVCTFGSDVAADDDINFEVEDLPLNSMGYFLVSQDVNFVVNPGGSSGTLCIASFNFGRYAGNVLDSGATGTVAFDPSVNNIPQGGLGTVMAMPGDSFNFQYWYRDVDGMGMPTSNFSDAVSIGFN